MISALMNPTRQVYVLFTSPVGYRNSTPSDVLDALLTYPNVHLYHLNMLQYARDTPLEDWIFTGALWNSKYLITHTSDVLRYLTLWKYQGTYLDLDVVMMRSLDTIEPNFAGAESDVYVNSAVMNFEGKIGQNVADLCMQDLLKNFNGRKGVSTVELC